MTNPYTRDSDTANPEPSPAALAAGYTDAYRKSLSSDLDAMLRNARARIYDVFDAVGGTTARLAEPHEPLPDLDPAEGRFIMLLLILVAPGRSTLPARALIGARGANGGQGQ